MMKRVKRFSPVEVMAFLPTTQTHPTNVSSLKHTKCKFVTSDHEEAFYDPADTASDQNIISYRVNTYHMMLTSLTIFV